MKHISSYLSQSGLKRHNHNDWLISVWQRAAPTALQQTCHPVTYHDNSLIRHLRHSPEFSSLGKIKLEVLPRQIANSQKRANHHHRKLSSSNKELLLDSAAHLSDPELRLSLERLAKTASES
jgi:hypothetical protein